MLDYTIKEYELNMPPTKATLSRLFDILNLEVSPIKIIDCMLFIRGKKMENSDPSEFDIKKLYQWFNINLRTLKHKDYEKVDPEWINGTQKNSVLAMKSL